MKKWDSAAEQNQEKKQLEEIAHLYFSNTDSSPKPRPVKKKKTKAIPVQPQLDTPLFIYCAAGLSESGLSYRFLYNLSVMLKIFNEPVLFVGSEQAFKARYSYGFRPHRERLVNKGRMEGLGGCFGPLGVCLLNTNDLNGLKKGRGDSLRNFLGLNVTFPFRYILSDEAAPDFYFDKIPSLILFLVTPATPPHAFTSFENKIWDNHSPRFDFAGIVIVDSDSTEESKHLHRLWQARLQKEGAEILMMDDYGRFPHFPFDRMNGHSRPTGGLEVLTNPMSPQTICYQKAASQIRQKRVEVLSVF